MTAPLITAEACEEAANLLAERSEIAEQLDRVKKAKKIRIEYGKPWKNEAGDERIDWRSTEPMSPTPAIMKLIGGDFEQKLAEIDAKLRALGVEPPSAKPEAV